MIIYITYRTIFCGEYLDDYAIADVISITTKPLTNKKAEQILTKYAKTNLDGDSVLVKKIDEEYNKDEPDYIAYGSEEDKENNSDYKYEFFINKPYTVKEN